MSEGGMEEGPELEEYLRHSSICVQCKDTPSWMSDWKPESPEEKKKVL